MSVVQVKSEPYVQLAEVVLMILKCSSILHSYTTKPNGRTKRL